MSFQKNCSTLLWPHFSFHKKIYKLLQTVWYKLFVKANTCLDLGIYRELTWRWLTIVSYFKVVFGWTSGERSRLRITGSLIRVWRVRNSGFESWRVRNSGFESGIQLMHVRRFIAITKTHLYNIDPLKPYFCIVKLGFTGVYIIFLISAQNIGCGYSLEPPCRGGSNEYQQSMFWAEIWKISFFLSEKFQFLQVKFSTYLNRRVFVMIDSFIITPRSPRYDLNNV